jgi:5-bromo-4-chloroindolyl phosphate hydrolysis protein
MVEYTDKELKEIQKRLMRAYNEICKLEKLLKKDENIGEQTSNKDN